MAVLDLLLLAYIVLVNGVVLSPVNPEQVKSNYAN